MVSVWALVKSAIPETTPVMPLTEATGPPAIDAALAAAAIAESLALVALVAASPALSVAMPALSVAMPA